MRKAHWAGKHMPLIRFAPGDCRRVQLLLDAYADSELQAETSMGIHRHLLGCAKCTEIVESILRTRRVLREAVAGTWPRMKFREELCKQLKAGSAARMF